MATSSAEGPLAAADTVPAAPEFEAFDTFPWSKHKAFLLGLVETLGGPNALLAPNDTHEGSTAFCRTVFFRRQTTRRIDLIRYNTFRASHPEYPSIDRRLLVALYKAAKDIPEDATNGVNGGEVTNGMATVLSPPGTTRSRRIIEAVAAGPMINPFDGTPTPPLTLAQDDDVPSWQKSAPRNELRVPKEALSADSAAAAAAGSSTGEAPYSDKFAKVVEAIQTGKELEGIRQIPDTVVRQAGITPLGKLKAPKKPWEMAASANAVSPLAVLGDTAPGQPGGATMSLVDLEFPPPPPPKEENKEEKGDGDGETKSDQGAPAS